MEEPPQAKESDTELETPEKVSKPVITLHRSATGRPFSQLKKRASEMIENMKDCIGNFLQDRALEAERIENKRQADAELILLNLNRPATPRIEGPGHAGPELTLLNLHEHQKE